MSTNKDAQAFLAVAVAALPITKRINDLADELVAAEVALTRSTANMVAANAEVVSAIRSGAAAVAIANHEEAARISKRDVDRWGAVIDQARAEIERAKASQTDEIAQLPQRIALVKAVNAFCVNLILVEYPKAAESVVKLLGALVAAETILQQNNVPGVPHFSSARKAANNNWGPDCLSVQTVLPRPRDGMPDLWVKARRDDFQTNCLAHLRAAGFDGGQIATNDLLA